MIMAEIFSRICFRCGGSGAVVLFDKVPMESAHCPACGGKGYIDYHKVINKT